MARRIQSNRPIDDSPAAVDRHVLQITSRISATIGLQFFQSVAQHLAKVLGADCTYIGEFVGGQTERVKTLAAWLDHQQENFVYELAGSASVQIAFGKPCICRAHAQTRFPADLIFPKLRAEGCVGIPLMNSHGLPIGLLMTVYRKPIPDTDIPKTMLEIFAPRAAAELEQRQQEEHLRKTEQRHRAFIALNADAMWRVEFEPPVSTALPEQEQLELIYQGGYLAEANDALARQLGVAELDQLIGCALNDLAPLSNPSARNATLHAIRSGYRFTTVETSPVGPDGKHRHMLRSQWGIVDDGMLRRLWGSNRDITELKQSEMALDESEQRLSGLLESLPLMVVIVQPDGKIAFCNDLLSQLTGWRPVEATGRNWVDLMIPVEERARVRSAIALTGTEPAGTDPTGTDPTGKAPRRHVHFESPLLGQNGDRPWMAWDSTSLRDSEGRIAATTIVGCDITDFKKLTAQLHQAQKLEHLGRMAGGIAHDFNNVLTVIMGYTGVLLEKRTPSDPEYGGLDQILTAAERAAGLTQRLFAFSRQRIVRPEVLNPAALVADDARMIGQLAGQHIQLVTNLDPATGFVKADAGHIHQIILNLAVNARDAMPEGGTLTISTSNTDAEYVQLTVTDTGTGMTEEVRSHLFEPFYTTKAEGKGTGLGLSTVYGIVQQSGGRIEVVTKPGDGTSFQILLPRVHRQVAPVQEPRTVGDVPRGTETILLVETQPEVRMVTASILRNLGYCVLEAQDSHQALEFARQPDGGAIHLLLTGAILPGASGSELADAIKTSCKEMRVLFMSAWVGPADGQNDISERGFAWLQKPFTPEALAVAVRQLLDQP